jgi:hypothetical protein
MNPPSKRRFSALTPLRANTVTPSAHSILRFGIGDSRTTEISAETTAVDVEFAERKPLKLLRGNPETASTPPAPPTLSCQSPSTNDQDEASEQSEQDQREEDFNWDNMVVGQNIHPMSWGKPVWSAMNLPPTFRSSNQVPVVENGQYSTPTVRSRHISEENVSPEAVHQRWMPTDFEICSKSL